MTGDFILAVASMMIARLKNDDVTLVLSQVSQFFPIYSHPLIDLSKMYNLYFNVLQFFFASGLILSKTVVAFD